MKKELSVWLMLSLAVVLGGLTASAVGGCETNTVDQDMQKPEQPEPGAADVVEPSDVIGPADVNDEMPAADAPAEAPAEEQPATAAEQPEAEQPEAEQPDAEQPEAEQPEGEQPEGEQPEGEQPEGEQPEAEQPEGEQPAAPAEGEDPSPSPEADQPAQPSAEDQSAGGVAEADQLVAADVSDVQEFHRPEEVLQAGGDWPQWGGTRLKNNVPNVTGLPTSWDIGRFDRRTDEWDDSSAENIKWFADLGSQTYGNPVVAGGQVYVGTNNGAGHLARYPNDIDLGCLLCFDEETGELLWQHSSEKLITGRVHDWPLQGICCAPLVEGDRLWFVTSRGEVRCLDTDGFYDGTDDGEVTGEIGTLLSWRAPAEPNTDNEEDLAEYLQAKEAFDAMQAGLAAGEISGGLRERLAERGFAIEGDVDVRTVTEGKRWEVTGNVDGTQRTMIVQVAGPAWVFSKVITPADKQEADTLWVFDMMKELGVSQHNMASCSVTAFGDLLFVNTSNGLDESHINLPAPDAPSFICMDKNSGEVLWTNDAPGTNILHGQWSSPAVAVIEGVPQALFAGGDGWLYSFRADRGQDGKPELLWKFDCNPKESKWILGGAGTRNNLIATPVIYDDLVYIAVGQDPEHGEGEGHLWCIDPTKRGDVSPQLAVKLVEGEREPIDHKRIQAVEPEKGEAAVDNPNSAVVWHYSLMDQNEDGAIDFEEEMHRSCGTVAIKDDVLYISDFSGLVHCLDAKGTKDGKPIVHFTYDMLAQSWGSALIADDKVYIGDEDGDVCVFEFGAENSEPIEEVYMGSSVYSTPVAANGTLYISTKDKLFAIAQEEQ